MIKLLKKLFMSTNANKIDRDYFYKIIKNHPDKHLNVIRSGQCINHDGEIYILFYSDEEIEYGNLPNSYKKDWYFYNLNSSTIERVHPYNNYKLTLTT